MKNNVLKQKDSGFTLIEMALVMVIGGVLLSFMGSALLTYVEKSRKDKTEQRIEAIKEALSQYLSVNRRYPCVARQNIAPGEAPATGTVGFGREVNTDCRGAAVNGTQINNNVRIGSIPTRSLNLPDEMTFDGWGGRFVYAVSVDLASLGATGSEYTNNGGVINVADSTGTPFVTNAHYVVLSTGRTKEGAFSYEGNQILPCTTGALDNENCDNDNTFITTLVNSEASTADFFDDYIYYQGQTAPPLLIPAGAVMSFNLATCPDGWTSFTPAEGKFVVAADDGVAPAPTTRFKNYKVSVGSGSSSGTYPIEPYTTAGNSDTINHDFSWGGTPQNLPDGSLIPPYIALLYCEKLPE